MDYAIQTINLSKTYKGGVQALRGVNLEVPKGSCFGLLGPNGAGKSTLVKILLSIVRPSGGAATLRGVDIRKAAARRRVGYLPEGHAFPAYLTAEGVCRYFGQLAGLSGAKLEREVADKLALVGLSEWGETKVKEFSKGMAQRVGVAQALIGDPELVFLDEPTDGVDPVARQGLRSVIREVTTTGSTVFINSHLLAEIEVLCDDVAILDKGRVVQRGSVSELTSAATGAGLRIRCRTGPLPDAVWDQLAAREGEREPDGWFRVTVQDEAEISTIIDMLRAAEVMIYAVEPQRMGLEEAFIQLIGADRGLQVSRGGTV
ncbi:Daunorubicin/doxorubicin resistance ATP-binding protein DrrA [Enhygromyxa salina]|uniref:Daunorubicin/doxorubicin resistance ATP-binding protein DrrA n=1 Tax=Enhygromyxa salina TaxID=215803 RepID=A0A2S9XMT9_9BACT|nr:ABC transporter ATP-binding protein [Enhygromyxa salina]PRP94163.1 Daunorubicin/doxorubicin resistance ATP-binding protein DrrA [Enhygromyxa salina]